MQTDRSPGRGWFTVPEGYYFHQGHGWVRPELGKIVRVGLDDFAQRLLGRPDAIQLPRVGQRLQLGEPGWMVTAEAAFLPMLSPVEGKVVAINHALRDSPELVNADPYGTGWLLEVRVVRLRTALANLLSGLLAMSWMDQITDRIRVLCDGQLGAVLPDGGEPVSGFIRAIAPDEWVTAARAFLLTE